LAGARQSRLVAYMCKIKYADLIGKPFRRGARGPHFYDCWGLVMEVYRRFGTDIPDYDCGRYESTDVHNCAETGKQDFIPITSLPPPVPCVVLIRFNESILDNHVGAHIGDNQFIHTREGIGVNVDRLDSPAWSRKISGFYIPGW